MIEAANGSVAVQPLSEAAKKRDAAEIARVICRHASAVGKDCHCGGNHARCGAILKHIRAAVEIQTVLIRTGRLSY